MADQVAEALIELIVDRRLRAGDSLPSTADLASEFNVSRTVVREAMAELAGRGILSRSQGRECVVKLPGPAEITGLLDFRVRHDGVDPLDVQEMREAVEVQTARLAAERRTPEQLEQLRTCLEGLETGLGRASFYEADVEFHRTLAQASGNTLLVLALDALRPLLQSSIVQATRTWRARGGTSKDAHLAHRKIYEAIEAADPQAAVEAMSEHLAQTRASMQQRMSVTV